MVKIVVDHCMKCIMLLYNNHINFFGVYTHLVENTDVRSMTVQIVDHISSTPTSRQVGRCVAILYNKENNKHYNGHMTCTIIIHTFHLTTATYVGMVMREWCCAIDPSFPGVRDPNISLTDTESIYCMYVQN